MSYSVEHVRVTLECDACGNSEKHEGTEAQNILARGGWSTVGVQGRQFFCCPVCVEKVQSVLLSAEHAAAAAQREFRAKCEHTWMQQGFLSKCSKCGTFR